MPPQSVDILNHYAHKRYNHDENCGGDGSDEDVNDHIKTGTAINPKGPRTKNTLHITQNSQYFRSMKDLIYRVSSKIMKLFI